MIRLVGMLPCNCGKYSLPCSFRIEGWGSYIVGIKEDEENSLLPTSLKCTELFHLVQLHEKFLHSLIVFPIFNLLSSFEVFQNLVYFFEEKTVVDCVECFS